MRTLIPAQKVEATRKTRVFVILVGGYGNIGDALIRRRALEWVRGLGPIEAYVGNAPKHWLEQMGIEGGDRVYDARSVASWILRLLASKGPKVLVLDPGEALLTAKQAPKELGFLAMTALAKLSGARIVRTPRAVRSPHPATVAIHRLACKLSDLVLWREARSAKLMGIGQLVPDIGFSEPTNRERDWNDRRRLTLSLRGLRSWPTDATLDALKRFSDSSGLEVTVVSQVREDEDRTLRLAAALGVGAVEWAQHTDSEQEAIVRTIYSESRYVISDRMHVLVYAALAGAVPLEMVENPVRKIKDHFALIGLEGISIDAEGLDVEVLLAFLDGARRLKPTVDAAVDRAQMELGGVESHLRAAVRSWT